MFIDVEIVENIVSNSIQQYSHLVSEIKQFISRTREIFNSFSLQDHQKKFGRFLRIGKQCKPL